MACFCSAGVILRLLGAHPLRPLLGYLALRLGGTLPSIRPISNRSNQGVALHGVHRAALQFVQAQEEIVRATARTSHLSLPG